MAHVEVHLSFTDTQLSDWVRKYYFDPVQFVRDMWDVEPYPWQVEFLNQIAAGERRMAMPTGHGVGKTAAGSWAALWFVLTRFPCKVPVTAPSAATLEDGLFAEIKMWHGRLPGAIGETLIATSDHIKLASAPESAFIVARTARAERPDALQGIHSDHVLFLIDEAAGVPDPVFEAGQGSMSASTACVCMFGNPTRATGYFHTAITEGKGVIWWVREVSCYEVLELHPNAPAQVFIDEMIMLYGEHSNAFRSRVLGKPPEADDETIIPLESVQAALDRDVMMSETIPMVWGLDVARLGRNESALAKRKGNYLVEPIRRFHGLDTMQLVGRVVAEYLTLPPLLRPREILVDGIGLGAPVVDRLRELGLPAIGINVSELKPLNDQHYNLKSELWWLARAWFAERNCKIPNIPHDADMADFIKHLTCVKIDRHSGGKLLVESKDKLAKRVGGSRRMDDADAFVLTFASMAASALYGSASGIKWNQPLRRNIAGIV